ncbi:MULTISPECIES: acyl-CoA carboxylase subunit epsilon [Frankia]|uniref:acyl-CoA carboxylase subunit epsilon n=1 Tax=Frankia TaxID=1854 RepID=UPI0028C3EA6E|nr:acyl-CoA carboxylase subunit epsilon [Frankia sp. ACN1ag]
MDGRPRTARGRKSSEERTVTQDDDGQASPPRLRLIRGNATPEEIAAVVALLAARAVPVESPSPVRSAWADPTQALRRPLATGAGSWRRSGMSPGVRTRAGW